jgi:hypothetical protein
MSHVNYVTFTIVVVLFGVVTLVGFAAARWRRADSMMHLDEWGLGGRSFGTFIAWFLLGGDLYTAYTFIAVPAAVFGGGAGETLPDQYTADPGADPGRGGHRHYRSRRGLIFIERIVVHRPGRVGATGW